MAATAADQDGIIVQSPEMVLTRSGQSEVVALPGTSYRDFAVTADQASFTLDGYALPAGSKGLDSETIANISWVPQGDDSTEVLVEFKTKPISSLINAVEGTEDRPTTPADPGGFHLSATS